MKGHFETILSLHSPIPGNLSQINDALSSAIQSIDVDKDIHTFISKHKNSKSGPDYAVYEPYDSSSSPANVNGSVNGTSESNPHSTVAPATRESPSTSLSTSTKVENSLSVSSMSSNSSGSVGSKEKVRALYDYNATEDNELSFKANDLITVLQKDESGTKEEVLF
jgi:hypothetical protein